MRAVICDTPGTLVLGERPAPEPAPGEVMVRVLRVGMCGTDYHIVRGTQPYLSYPRIMGHELAAEVIDPPPETGLRPGGLVCVMPYLSCGACHACRRGRENCCLALQVLGVHRDGGLTERLSIHPRFLIDAAGLTPDQAAMVEFLAIGHHAVGRSGLAAGDRALVAGAGPIGMAVALFAARRGAEVTILDGDSRRARFCVDTLGARNAVPLDDDSDAALAALSGGVGFDVVFDATGNRQAMEAGFDRVAHGGSYVLVSIVTGTITFDDPGFHKRETTLMSSRNATRADFEAVIAAIRAGEVPTDRLHTHGATLAELPQQIDAWMRPGTGLIKAIVTV